MQLIFLSLHIGAASKQHSALANAGLKIMGFVKSDAGHVAAMGAGLYAAAKVHGLEQRVDALASSASAKAEEKKELYARLDTLDAIVIKGKKARGPADLSLEKRAEDVERELFFLGDGSSGSAQSYLQKMREDLLDGDNNSVLFSAPVDKNKIKKAKPGSIAHLLNTKTDARDTTKLLAELVRNAENFDQFKELLLKKETELKATEAKRKDKTDKTSKAAEIVNTALAAGHDAQPGPKSTDEKKAANS